MNPIAEEILMHYGVKRRSGRWPWGSGDSPFQHSGDFLSRVQELKRAGVSESEIAKAMGLNSTTDLRAAYSIAKDERRQLQVATAKSLTQDGLNPTEVGRKMGLNESSVRSLLNEDSNRRMNSARETAETLKKELADKKVLDVGAGVERELGVSKEKLNQALYILEAEGVAVRDGIGIPTGPRKQTNTMILRDPNVSLKDVYADMSLIKPVGDYHSTDGGKTFDKRAYPASIDSNRVQIRYGDEGGTAKDGVIELRRGVQDLDLGNSHYAQVRILVDGTHYLKGMAMYSDNMPDGVDIVFNTNKKAGTPKMDVLKPIQADPDNPFGAYIKADGQSYYTDSKGDRKLSAINKLKEEGDWDTMSRNLSSQFLSKQPYELVKKQLDLTYADKRSEFDEIMSLTNPTVKKKMLLDFADECDSAIVHLKAAALPRQETRVILPITKLKDTEVYAPYLKNGEKVVLIRYPHGGTFEIPELTVNNKNPSAKSILGNARDAIGINYKVAERLSGADFDGDTVTVIPVNDKVRVKTTKREGTPYESLADFDPKTQYAERPGMKVMTKAQTQKEMGVISNLITDMNLKGAPDSEIVRAVKHSMVVIDAAKHRLDYKQSERDNGIAELKQKWQPKYDENGNVVGFGGASTLISKRKQDVRVPERQGSGRIDPDTGKVTYKESGRTYVDKNGKVVPATTTVKLLSTVDDVRTLSSGNPKENAYADYANQMKSLANTARKEYLATGRLKYDSGANKTYKAEVTALDKKLALAEMNAPRERQARAIANSVVKAKIQSNPDLADKANKKELNKIEQAALYDARNAVGASGKQTRITITDREWEAIQAGAISDTKLSSILRYADQDAIKERALPKSTKQLTSAKVNRIKDLSSKGYTIAEIADRLGISSSTVSNYIN